MTSYASTRSSSTPCSAGTACLPCITLLCALPRGYTYFGSTCWGRHDLVGVLAGQPIRLLSRVFDAAGSSGSSSGAAAAFGWDIEVWHERLLAGTAAGKGPPTARATTRSTATGAARLGFFS